MSDLKDDLTKSGSQPLYSPPRVVRMGDLNEGKGVCSGGSGNPDAPGCTSNGTNASFGYCRQGNTASPGDCTAGFGAASTCVGGNTVG